MRHKKYVWIVIAVWVALCLTVGAEESVIRATIDQDGIQRVDILGGSYFFKPNHIIVKVNIPVEFTVSKERSFTPHDIVAHSPEAGIEFQENLSTTPKTIKFTPSHVGTYPFYCSKKAPFSKSHREKGMEGVIEVIP